MFNVLLIKTSLSGFNQQIGFPNMETCLETRNTIIEQSEKIEAVCLPIDSKYQEQQFNEFFDKFIEIVQKTKNMENRWNSPNLVGFGRNPKNMNGLSTPTAGFLRVSDSYIHGEYRIGYIHD